MIQRPQFITDNEIIEKIESIYGIVITQLAFLPVGEASWCFKAASDSGDLFIKLTQSGLYGPSIEIPSCIYHTLHIPFTIPALTTKNGQLWDVVNECDIVVYPYTDGHTFMNYPVHDAQWQAIGEFFQKLHSIELPPELQSPMMKEVFASPHGEGAQKVMDYALTGSMEGTALALATFIQERQEEMERIISRTRELGEMLKEQKGALVTCHADPNRANLMMTEKGQLFVIDWDGVILAPRERDLMFFTASDQQAFFTGYNKKVQYEINLTAIAYYKFEWVVQEFNDYGTRIFFAAYDDSMNQHALHAFKELFAPGNVIADAYSTEEYL